MDLINKIRSMTSEDSVEEYVKMKLIEALEEIPEDKQMHWLEYDACAENLGFSEYKDTKEFYNTFKNIIKEKYIIDEVRNKLIDIIKEDAEMILMNSLYLQFVISEVVINSIIRKIANFI